MGLNPLTQIKSRSRTAINLITFIWLVRTRFARRTNQIIYRGFNLIGYKNKDLLNQVQ